MMASEDATKRLSSKKQTLDDAYAAPANFLEIDVINPITHGIGNKRYTDYEVRMKVREKTSPKHQKTQITASSMLIIIITMPILNSLFVFLFCNDRFESIVFSAISFCQNCYFSFFPSIQTNLPVFRVKESSVRRRYSDFEWLRNELERDSKVHGSF